MNQPLFSILCTNFNNGRYIGEMIQSVLAQTYTNWELVIVDDASTDDSIERVRPFLVDERIRLEVLNQNIGAGGAVAVAADLAAGKLMGRLDADDALPLHALETMVLAHQENPDAALITSYVTPCDEMLVPIEVNWVKYKAIGNGSCILKSPTVGAFASFKRAGFQKTSGFDRTYKRAVDLDIYLKLEEVGSVVTLEKQLYLYRRNPNGISQGSNGILAKQYAYLAQIDAYKRRRRSDFHCNWTSREACEASLKCFQSRVHNQGTGWRIVCKEFWNAIKRTSWLAFSIVLYRNAISAIVRSIKTS